MNRPYLVAVCAHGAFCDDLRRKSIAVSFAFVTFLVLPNAPLCACLWSYGTDHHGHRTERGQLSPSYSVARLLEHRQDRAYWEGERDRLKPHSDPDAGYQDQNDYAVALIHLGEYDDALAILQRIERDHPDLYSTAANIGTLYELRGDNAKALAWIQEGIRRDEDSHYGSEWLHVKILEAKLAIEKDPDWLKSHSVLGISFGDEATLAEPTTLPRGNGGQELTLDEVREAIKYQLEERFQFVKPPDAIVGDLLADWANAIALDYAVERAIPIYELALEYGAPRDALVRERKRHFEALVAANPDSGRETSFDLFREPEGVGVIIGAAIAIVSIVGGGIWFWFRWRALSA